MRAVNVLAGQPTYRITNQTTEEQEALIKGDPGEPELTGIVFIIFCVFFILASRNYWRLVRYGEGKGPRP